MEDLPDWPEGVLIIIICTAVHTPYHWPDVAGEAHMQQAERPL
jgi:hypothetical protein